MAVLATIFRLTSPNISTLGKLHLGCIDSASCHTENRHPFQQEDRVETEEAASADAVPHRGR